MSADRQTENSYFSMTVAVCAACDLFMVNRVNRTQPTIEERLFVINYTSTPYPTSWRLSQADLSAVCHWVKSENALSVQLERGSAFPVGAHTVKHSELEHCLSVWINRMEQHHFQSLKWRFNQARCIQVLPNYHCLLVGSNVWKSDRICKRFNSRCMVSSISATKSSDGCSTRWIAAEVRPHLHIVWLETILHSVLYAYTPLIS